MGQMQNKAAVESFLEYLQHEKRYSPHTSLSYRNDLEAFLGYLRDQYGMTALQKTEYDHVRSWLAELKEGGIGSRSINRKISSLRSFYKYCLRSGLLSYSPVQDINGPKMSKKLPVFVKEKETERLLERLESGAEDWDSLNAKMLILILYSTGMRLSEMIRLTDDHIDFSQRQLKVLGKGNKERIIPLNRELLRQVKEYQDLKGREFEKPENSLLVTRKGKKIYPKYAYLLVNRFMREAGPLSQRSPHVLRHTVATHLMNRGAGLNAVKELLGHSSLASTQVYTHNTIETLKKVHKKAHPKS
jgi:integrase/recombinase XerC